MSTFATTGDTPTDAEILALAEQLASARPARAQTERASVACTIQTITPAGGRYLDVSVSLPDALAATLRHPAQYTTLRYGALDPRFLVIATPPDVRAADTTTWRFLIDRNGTLGGALDAEGAPGQQVHVSEAEGRGFPTDSLRAGELLCFSTGSGVAIMRPVIEWLGAHAPERLAHVTMFHGEHYEADFAYPGLLEQWRAAGAAAHLIPACVSDSKHPRHVQHALDPEAHAIREATVLLGGAPVMVRAVTAHLLRLGVAPERLRVNI